MRIYFNGSFSVGKTSLKLSCANKYNLIAVPEIFRTILAEREISLSAARSKVYLTEEIQKEVIVRQFNEEIRLLELAKLESKNGICACRGLDSFSFLVKFCSPDFVEKAMKSIWLTDYINWLKRKDAFHFLIKPDKALLHNDGIRDMDWELSLEIYGIVECLLRTQGIKYILLSDNNMSEREATIDGIVKGI